MSVASIVSVEEFELNKAKYHCADYNNPVETVVCVGDKRLVLKDCLFSIKLVTERYKFPDQTVITFRARKVSGVKIEHRNPSAWNTAETYLPISHAEALFTEALKLIAQYKQKESDVVGIA